MLGITSTLSVINPDDQFGMPIYEGNTSDVGDSLVDGVYHGTLRYSNLDRDISVLVIILDGDHTVSTR